MFFEETSAPKSLIKGVIPAKVWKNEAKLWNSKKRQSNWEKYEAKHINKLKKVKKHKSLKFYTVSYWERMLVLYSTTVTKVFLNNSPCECLLGYLQCVWRPIAYVCSKMWNNSFEHMHH